MRCASAQLARCDSTIRENPAVNEQSLERVNAFLAAVADRTQRGELLEATPAEIGREFGFPDPLSTARAVRALDRPPAARAGAGLLPAARRHAGRRPASGRRSSASGRRARKRPEDARAGRRAGGLAYSDMGRATVDRLVELGREVGPAPRAAEDVAGRGSRESRDARGGRAARADVSPSVPGSSSTARRWPSPTCRTLLASARATARCIRTQRLPDSEMEAILGVLKGNGDQPDEDHATPDDPVTPAIRDAVIAAAVEGRRAVRAGSSRRR